MLEIQISNVGAEAKSQLAVQNLFKIQKKVFPSALCS